MSKLVARVTHFALNREAVIAIEENLSPISLSDNSIGSIEERERERERVLQLQKVIRLHFLLS